MSGMCILIIQKLNSMIKLISLFSQFLFQIYLYSQPFQTLKYIAGDRYLCCHAGDHKANQHKERF